MLKLLAGAQDAARLGKVLNCLFCVQQSSFVVFVAVRNRKVYMSLSRRGASAGHKDDTMMGQTEIRPTATIYQFPFRERMAAKATREQRFARMEAEARRIGNGVMQGAWYHDDAVVESTGKMS